MQAARWTAPFAVSELSPSDTYFRLLYAVDGIARIHVEHIDPPSPVDAVVRPAVVGKQASIPLRTAMHDIGPAQRVDGVSPPPTEQTVRAPIGPEKIAALPTQDAVDAAPAHDLVAALPAKEDVGATSTEEEICFSTTNDAVIPSPTPDSVRTAESAYHVTAGRAVKGVVIGRSGNRACSPPARRNGQGDDPSQGQSQSKGRGDESSAHDTRTVHRCSWFQPSVRCRSLSVNDGIPAYRQQKGPSRAL